MAFISDESILEVKRAVDIYEVVRGYLPALKKAGANYKALCPFHQEKTPSFNVHPEKQIYKCFGCGKAGDAISFVMEMEKADYPEAIRILAEKAGIPLRYQETGAAGGPRRDDLYRINDWAAGVYRKLLASDEAAPAREYLRRRGVTPETEETFRLGYASKDWEGLLSQARKAGFDERLAMAAGLAIQRENGPGCYDRFRGRLMFPIADARGKTIGFGARALGDEHPKYINTSETAIFSKGRNFYGLDLQREHFEQARSVHIVEGYFDVILPYQHGVRGLVATLGTALTRDHLKILRRYVDSVVLVFDGDEAGKRANERGLDLLLGENLDLFVAGLPADEDPCDVVVNRGADRLRECLAKREELFEFLVASTVGRHGTETPSALARVVEEVLERVGQIPDAIKAEVLVKRLAERFRLDERTLRSRLRRAGKEEAEPVAAGSEAPSPEEAVGRQLLALLFASPELGARVREAVPLDRFPGASARAVAGRAYANPALTGGDVLALLEDAGQRDLLAGALEEATEDRFSARRLADCVRYVDEASYRASAPQRQESLRKSEEADRVLKEIVNRRQQQPLKTRSLPGH